MARANRDPQHLAVLQDYYANHRLIPSYSAISNLLGFRAKTRGIGPGQPFPTHAG
ncbi:MAG: hypothetical protein Q7R45_08635 [Sulfuricaulis sp.]|nr:hypothetical protein [Sulfuricaulis sp.]